jgi:hypothetical protein
MGQRSIYMSHSEYQEVSRQEYERKTRDWELRFCFLPHKCLETNKFLWLQYAYRGRKWRRFDTEFVLLTDKWMCKEEFVILRLMDKV